jgi:peptidoglycan-N-acetylglucosamine deacetylase
MESSDDEAEPASFNFSKTLIVLLLLFPSCNKPQRAVVEILHPKDSTLSIQKSAPTIAKRKKSKKKKLYLTFDDGPNKGTKNVLSIVKDEEVPVTFFIVGEHVFASLTQAQMWDSLQRTKGVELCNHSYTHANNKYESFYQHPESVVEDFKRTEDSLDLTNHIVRTPGRNIWRIDSLVCTDLKKSAAAADSLQKAGFIVMGWDLEWHYDHKSMSVTNSAQELVKQIDSVFKNKKTKRVDHLVLLAHDQVYGKRDDSIQLRQFIQLLKQQDEYELSLATSYPGVGVDSVASVQ